jgi:hypothetical protein
MGYSCIEMGYSCVDIVCSRMAGTVLYWFISLEQLMYVPTVGTVLYVRYCPYGTVRTVRYCPYGTVRTVLYQH